MKKGVLTIFIFGLLVISLIGVINASFELGDESHEISTTYGPGESINGWINISLDNEPASSLFTAFGKSFNLLELLDLNSVSYSCSPFDCSYDVGYETENNEESSQSFNINRAQSKLLGIKLEGNISSISSLRFDLFSDVTYSCSVPLKIDILNDGLIEWQSEKLSPDFSCYIEHPYGCWDAADWVDGNIALLTTNPYCQTIEVPTVKQYKIGASVVNRTAEGDSVKFDFSIDIGASSGFCDVSTTSAGNIECIAELDETVSEGVVNATICINVNSLSNEGKYGIKWENTNPCGGSKDFPIFINAGKFGTIGDIAFNNELIENDFLGSEIYSWIEDRYNGECNPCIIPIKFSGVSQLIDVDNLELIYSEEDAYGDTISLSQSKIWEIAESEFFVNSDFIKINLENAELSVPSEFGSEELVLELGGSEVLTQDIEIRPVPAIIGISPDILPSLVPVTFLAILNGITTNLTYSWDFGDGTTGISNQTVISHTYSEIGVYDLKLIVSNRFGNSTKTISIKVISPEEAINSTIESYREDIKNISVEINKLPAWIKTEIEKKASLDDFEASLDSLEKRYNDAFEPSEYVEIMKDLIALEIPTKFDVSQTINPFEFFPNEDRLDLDALEILGAGTGDKTREAYASAANNWLRQNLGVSLESKTYYFYLNGIGKPIFSYIKVVLDPKNDLDEFYFIINGNPEGIIFNGEVNSRDIGESAVGVIFNELSTKTTLEFLYPSQLDVINLPIYISPEFKDLEVGVEIGPCNNDGVCDSGENPKNCRKDCKPIGWTVFWLFMVLLIAFVVYIALQEWYKKHYEAKLFPNKSQLFNLVNFMSISLNQGVKKSEIFHKLKDLGWSGEQLNYVWNKLHGKRTGMWEIPILKWVENKQVKKELAKRQGVASVNGLRSK